MKKQQQPLKLTLHRETIRHLATDELAPTAVLGGAGSTQPCFHDSFCRCESVGCTFGC
jgi:hypothetical protein